jgi:hypothetical protein
MNLTGHMFQGFVALLIVFYVLEALHIIAALGVCSCYLCWSYATRHTRTSKTLYSQKVLT